VRFRESRERLGRGEPLHLDLLQQDVRALIRQRHPHAAVPARPEQLAHQTA
jgi:hypothetical protein